jgi:hypothetical protein
MATKIAVSVQNSPQREFEAHAALYPGMLLEMNSDGEVLPHATAAGESVNMWAKEDELQGKTVNDAYAAGDQVQVLFPRRGDVVYGRVANGASITKGDYVTSNGDGYVKAHTGSEKASGVLGIALESVDMTDSSGADPDGFIKILVG